MDAPPARTGRAATRAPVMADVGRLAGVSHQTVSRVLNGSPSVSPATRARVVEAMRALGYRPNSVARALATGRTATVGVIGFDTTLYGPASVMFGIEQAAHEEGYLMVVASLLALDRASVGDVIERLRLRSVDGILVIAPDQRTADALSRAPLEIPVVAAEAGPAELFPVISVDQQAGAASATEHLLALGHTTVWHISGPADWFETRERIEGWRGALRAAGAEPPPVLVGDWSARAGYDLGRRLSRDPAVTAIFAANDQMALGVLRALHEAGREVPGEVSIVGFDDVPESPYFTPPLTTVRQEFAEVGRRSLRSLVRLIETGARAPASRVAPQLIVRSSTTVAPR